MSDLFDRVCLWAIGAILKLMRLDGIVYRATFSRLEGFDDSKRVPFYDCTVKPPWSVSTIAEDEDTWRDILEEPYG